MIGGNTMKTTSVNSKNKRYTALAWILAILVIAVAIPLNLIFDRMNVNFDMTPNSMYTLTKTTQDYLNELDARGEVVDVYFLEKMETIENELELLALYRTLLAYDEHPCFNLIDFDPDTDPETLRKINPDNSFNLSDDDFLFVHGDRVKRLPASLMYTYDMGKDSEGNQIVRDAEFRAENYFTGYMKSVIDGELPTVYFLTGHDEVPLSKMSKLQANLKNYNYGAQELNLTTADAVPEDCCILIIADPKYDLTDAEYEKVYAYTQLGGNISLLLGPNQNEVAYKNLEALTAGYCIGFNYDRVSETDPNRHSHEETYAMMCDIMPANPESEEDLTAELVSEENSLPTYMPYSRSFYENFGSNYTACSIDTLIQTATTAISEPYGGKDLDPVSKEGINHKLSMYSIDTLRNNSKLVVFGSADIITDEGTGAAYYINPLQLFLTSITWMYNSDVDMNISNKKRTYDSLDVNSDKEATMLMSIFIGIPAIVALAGVVVWLRRRDA
ncbi:MAG TPA: hypothetical protein DCG49_00065 [Ruminococcus sp.]|nr:hypothetical protein [Ruminococcus sp.]